MGIAMMLLGTSALSAGGKYAVRPDSKPISTDMRRASAKKATHSSVRGLQRINRLRRFERIESSRGSFTRMKRQHFIR